jgi:hypothetical protein
MARRYEPWGANENLAIAFWPVHNEMPSGLIRQVKPLLPACSSRDLPSCIMMIAASLTMGSGAAVLTFARYAGSEVATSAVGYWSCAQARLLAMHNVATNPRSLRMVDLP